MRKSVASNKLLQLILPPDQWQRNLYVVVLSVFLSQLGFTFVMPFLPLYIQQELGISNVAEAALWSGLAMSVGPLVAAFVSPIWGAAADRFGRKPLFIRALVSFGVLMASMAVITNVYQLMVVRVLWGVLGGLAVLAIAMVTTGCPRDQVTRSVGLVQAAQNIAYAVGPALGGILAERYGLRNCFLFTVVLYVIALILSQALYREPPLVPQAPSASRVTKKEFGRGLPVRILLPIVAVLFVAQFVDKSFGSILPLYVTSLGVVGVAAASQSGIITSLGALATAVAASVVGRLVKKHSPRLLIAVSLVGGLSMCLPIAFVGNTTQLLVLRTLLGLLAGGTITLAYTVGGLAMPAHRRATALGFLSSGAQFGSALGPMAAGVVGGISLRGVFAFDALLYGLGLLALQADRKRHVAGHDAAGAPDGPGPPGTTSSADPA